jgi:hypothetical protein
MKKFTLQENINKICETAPGRFRIVLNFATVKIVKHLLDEDYKYVWVHNHMPGSYSAWHEFDLPIVPKIENKKILAKTVRYNFIMETSEFKNLLPKW